MDNDQMDVILNSVLPRYGLRVHGLIPVPQDPQTVLVDSDRGVKRLRIDTDLKRVSRRHALWEHVAKQGFRRVPRHIRTLYGESSVVNGDCIYSLSDDWEGRPPELMPLDMRLVGRNLAALHKAVKGLQLPEEIALPKRHGTWLKKFSDAGDELASRQQAWAELAAPNELQERLLQHYEWIAEQIGRSVEGLVAGKYEEVARRSQQEGEFAIGEYRLSDLRINHEGRVATLYIDDAVSDLPLYDAAKFAHGLIERGHGEMAQEFLAAYAEEASLSQHDLVILDSYLTFPHAAYRHIVQYARLKKGADVFAERLHQSVTNAQGRGPNLYSLDNVRWV
jgi:CotS family spore coat protein